MQSTPFERRRAKPDRADCFFYHSFDLPHGEIFGDWDLRGRFDQYIGGLDLLGKRVLDIGTASGFLSFEAERRGAKVTSFDADSTVRYCRLPHTPSRYTIDRQTALEADDRWLNAVKNSYWYMHHEFNSDNKVHYGDLYNLPDSIGKFEVVLLGQFLVHNRSAIDVLEAVARKTERYLVITEGLWEIEEAGARFLGNASAKEDFWSTWLYSPAFFSEICGMLGFALKSLTRNKFMCNHEKHKSDMELGTFIFERVGTSSG